MVRHTTKTRGGFIWLVPVTYKPNWKINITRDDSTVDEVSNDITSATVTLGINEQTSYSNIILQNKNGKYNSRWDTGEQVEIYADYSDASNKIFKGFVEKKTNTLSSNGRFVELYVLGGESELLNVFVNKTYTNTSPEDIITDIINNKATNITYTPITTGEIIEKITFNEKTAWNAIVEVCKLINHDVYVDTSFVVQHFEKGSVTNETEFISYGINLIGITNQKDRGDVKNKIRAYGANVDSSTDVLLLKTVNDSTSQTNFGIRELPLHDTSKDTMEEIAEFTDFQLTDKKDLKNKGFGTALGLPTLKAGQSVRISSQYDDIKEGYYTIVNVSHSFRDRFVTTFQFQKEFDSLAKQLNKIKLLENSLISSTNPNDMTNSYTVKFDEEPSKMSHSNTEELNGELVLSSGQTNGTSTADILTLDEDASSFEVRIFGQDIDSSTVSVSNNGGLSYDEASTYNTEIAFTSGSDKNLKFRINLVKDANNTTPKVYAISVLTK